MAVTSPANFLSIDRHIAKVRNQPGLNFLALALQDIQSAIRKLQKSA